MARPLALQGDLPVLPRPFSCRCPGLRPPLSAAPLLSPGCSHCTAFARVGAAQLPLPGRGRPPGDKSAPLGAPRSAAPAARSDLRHCVRAPLDVVRCSVCRSLLLRGRPEQPLCQDIGQVLDTQGISPASLMGAQCKDAGASPPAAPQAMTPLIRGRRALQCEQRSEEGAGIRREGKCHLRSLKQSIHAGSKAQPKGPMRLAVFDLWVRAPASRRLPSAEGA